MKHLISIIVCLLMALCHRSEQLGEGLANQTHQEKNSVYYWKTVFRVDSAERAFIRDNNIGRIYLRMFDVVRDREAASPETATYPNATVRIDDEQYQLLKDSLGGIEIVPVVYITLDALKVMDDHEGVLANNIVTRVRNMAQYHDLLNVSELQLDCDWTESSEKSYFKLCNSVKSNIANQNLKWSLSSTIRLHQLARRVPPVDRGVLMVYNTGSFDNPDTRNSIIDVDDIKPYLKRLPSYQLHLDIAYPTYSWQLLFRDRTFIGLTNGLEIADTNKFFRRNERQYIAKHDIPHNGKIIQSGDMVRSEMSDYVEIKAVKSHIDRLLSDRPHSNIIYHLDCKNLSNYSNNEIQSILSADR